MYSVQQASDKSRELLVAPIMVMSLSTHRYIFPVRVVMQFVEFIAHLRPLLHFSPASCVVFSRHFES